MKHLDLFSGIAGFTLAASRVWGEVYKCVGFVENDKFCQELLKRRFPNVPIWGDIRTFATDSELRRCEGAEIPEGEKREKIHLPSGSIDLITGGFPCQPFSAAGKQGGTKDDRHLWPEMYRVIRHFVPRWVIAENVKGLLAIEDGLVFDEVLSDLEKIGYEVEAYIIPACAVGAPHRRDRVWIVAYLKCGGRGEGAGDRMEPEKQVAERQEFNNADTETSGNAPDANDRGQEKQEQQTAGDKQSGGGNVANAKSGQSWKQTEPEGREDTGRGSKESNAPDTGKQGLQRGEREQPLRHGGQLGGNWCDERWDWNQDWTKIAAKFCRVHDGFSVRVDGFELSKSRHRVERLKALGNAIVPAVAEKIMEAIKEYEANHNS